MASTDHDGELFAGVNRKFEINHLKFSKTY
jgi:hypothetical protein